MYSCHYSCVRVRETRAPGRDVLGMVLSVKTASREHTNNSLPRRTVSVACICSIPRQAMKMTTCVHCRWLRRAVNARNVLVSSCSTAPYGAVAKLADLGLSRCIRQHATHKTTNTVGTLR